MKKLVATPPERIETVRQAILAVLERQLSSVRDISTAVHIPEKEVYGHLQHIEKTLRHQGLHLQLIPAECLSCGFTFTKRERLTKPRRCPVCGGEHISDPLYSITSP